jgi:hypothetical protein
MMLGLKRQARHLDGEIEAPVTDQTLAEERQIPRGPAENKSRLPLRFSDIKGHIPCIVGDRRLAVDGLHPDLAGTSARHLGRETQLALLGIIRPEHHGRGINYPVTDEQFHRCLYGLRPTPAANANVNGRRLTGQ